MMPPPADWTPKPKTRGLGVLEERFHVRGDVQEAGEGQLEVVVARDLVEHARGIFMASRRRTTWGRVWPSLMRSWTDVVPVSWTVSRLISAFTVSFSVRVTPGW